MSHSSYTYKEFNFRDYFKFQKILKLFLIINLFFLSKTNAENLAAETPDIFKDHMLNLSNIHSETSDEISVINITFNKKLNWQQLNIEIENNSLKIILPDTITPKPNQILTVRSPYIEQMNVYQSSANEVTIKLLSTYNVKFLSKATDLSIIANRIIITVDHKIMENILPKVVAINLNTALPLITHSPLVDSKSYETKAINELKANSASDQSIELKSSENSSDLEKEPISVSPAKLLQSNEKNSKSKKIFNFNINDNLTFVSISLFFLALIIVLSFLIRRHVLMSNLKSHEVPIPLKLINQLILSPKVKLSLVQIGNEKILLSVGPESSQLLTHIGQIKSNVENFNNNYQSFTSLNSQKLKSNSPSLLSEPLLQNHLESKNSPKTEKFLVSNSVDKNSKENIQTNSNDRNLKNNSQDKEKNILQALEQIKKHQNNLQETNHNKSIKKTKINYSIGDDGIAEHNQQAAQASPKAIQDVTQLIRDKLKALPKLS